MLGKNHFIHHCTKSSPIAILSRDSHHHQLSIPCQELCHSCISLRETTTQVRCTYHCTPLRHENQHQYAMLWCKKCHNLPRSWHHQAENLPFLTPRIGNLWLATYATHTKQINIATIIVGTLFQHQWSLCIDTKAVAARTRSGRRQRDEATSATITIQIMSSTRPLIIWYHLI